MKSVFWILVTIFSIAYLIHFDRVVLAQTLALFGALVFLKDK